MKKKKMSALLAASVLLALIFNGWILAGETIKTGFTSPSPGDTVKNRAKFKVSIQIDNFDPGSRYWVAIATVTGHSSSWGAAREWYNSAGGTGKILGEEIKKIFAQWQIDQFWPKFYVSENPCVNDVYDGGSNPLKGIEPQPMILLILKVEDRMHNNFVKWLREGPEKGYPGFSSSELESGIEVLARCEIFFL